MTPDTDKPWLDWPVCPACRQRRQTACPVCQVAGAEFPLAEYLEAPAPMHTSRGQPEIDPPSGASDEDFILLICLTCDEVFTPRFYRNCQRCGHDFEEGIEVSRVQPDEITGRAVLVLFGLAVLTCGVLLYFWQVLRK